MLTNEVKHCLTIELANTLGWKRELDGSCMERVKESLMVKGTVMKARSQLNTKMSVRILR